LAPRSLTAQTPGFLTNDHWSRAALHRLAVNGQLPAAVASLSWPARRSEVQTWLDSAQNAADTSESATRRLHVLRSVLNSEQRSQRIRAGLAAGALSSAGALRAGTMERVPEGFRYPGPVASPNEQLTLLRAELYAALTGNLEVGTQGRLRGSDAELESAVLAGQFSILEAWIGRRSLALGNAPADGLVLNQITLDGGGLSVRRGVRVPWLGRIHPELTLARMARSGAVEHPWFHSGRITIAPSSALAIGLNRAAIFGGENHIGITPLRVLLMLLGRPDIEGKDSDFENQVASIDVFWRTRLGGLPVALHAEAGADDAGYAFLRVPGVIAGVELGELPALPALGLGLEVVHIARRCCSYPPWYQHGGLADGWTDRGRLLGHPLGGAGTELATHWRVETAQTPVLAAGRIYLRERDRENLLAPLRQGRSAGGRLDLVVPWRRTQMQLRANAEWGSGWQSSDLTFLGQLYFE